jgi:hypothetical protein
MGLSLALIAILGVVLLTTVIAIIVAIARAFRAGRECGEPDDWKRKRRR